MRRTTCLALSSSTIGAVRACSITLLRWLSKTHLFAARDIQAWEYVPLGPFTAKVQYHTTSHVHCD
jgi:hypothetical protein